MPYPCADSTLVPLGREQARNMLRRTLAAPLLGDAELEARVTAFIRYARAMNLSLDDHWVVLRGGRVVFAGTYIALAGRSAMLLLPGCIDAAATPEDMIRLVEAAVQRAEERGAQIIQCLVWPDDDRLPFVLLAAGFDWIADLMYLERRIGLEEPVAGATCGREPEPTSYAWASYSPALHDVLARLVLETYRESRDCPGLNAVRDIEDVLAAHRGAGRFAAHRWMLLFERNRAAGCVLLAESPVDPHLEVAYMGVHPDFRGRGLGRVLIDRALALAQAEGFPKVTLAVDSRNAPARRIYHRAGFACIQTRRAFVWARRPTNRRP